MEKRESLGLFILVFGIILAFFGFLFSKGDDALAFLVIGLLILVFGTIILLNKNEDKIEEINPSKRINKE
ncbi:MAG TPA: hypothetical protein VJ895_01560 [Candidatus Nanoarchaeia archaeon]|nr:hypothetical protein [Candidatus Nanoarchaeia archaeon]